MYKVLVFGMTSNVGGIESFIMSYYKRFNRSKIHFDFLCNTYEKVAYEEEIKELHSKIYRIPMRSKDPLKYKRKLKSFFKENSKKYDCIWVNVNSLANIDYLKMAKKYGIKRRIIHSHNSQNMDGKLRGFLHLYNKERIAKYVTDFWACSPSAAKWFYNEKLMPKVKIIKNAIDLSRVKFNIEKREKIRKKYNLEDSFVIGNIGRLHFQKNQQFLISLMPKLLEKKNNIKLVLIGNGPDEVNLKKEVEKSNLMDHVVFTGIQKDISGWLSSFDLFVFPSKFEGLPIAGLEAQGNGIPVLASNTAIPHEARLNLNVETLDLSMSKDIWVKEIIRLMNRKRIDEITITKNFDKAGYNITSATPILEESLLDFKGE